MSAAELAALVCCDLGAIVRGRSLPAGELHEHLQAGVSWVPANHALTPEESVRHAGPARWLRNRGTIESKLKLLGSMTSAAPFAEMRSSQCRCPRSEALP